MFTAIEALCVPTVCSPLTNQYISSVHDLDEFRGLDFANYEGNTTSLAIGVLIGIDFYHSLITGITLRSKAGPVACGSKLGYALGGRIGGSTIQSHCFETHLLRSCVETDVEPDGLRQDLQKFWNVAEISHIDLWYVTTRKPQKSARYLMRLAVLMDPL